MSKSAFTIFVSALILAIVGGTIWLLFFYKNGQKAVDLSLTVKEYLPFGKIETSPNQTNKNKPEQNNTGLGNDQSPTSGKLRKLVSAPVAGFTILSGTTTLVRYLEKDTGHIYNIGTQVGSNTRITNTTIPRVHEAIFANDGNSVIIRYLRDDNSTIESYSADIPENGVGDLKGTFLEQNISDISVSPDTKKIFYLNSFGGGTVGATANPNSSGRQQIFGSLLNEWISNWSGDKVITLTTKSSGGIPGFMYRLDPINKSFEKIFGGVLGLSALASPDGRYVYYGASGGAGLSGGLYDIKNKSFQSLSAATIASDKCVWKNDGTVAYCGVPEIIPQIKLPDFWYQGRILFSDRLWVIKPNEGTSKMLSELRPLAKTSIDMIKPMVSQDGRALFFINKKDSSLWFFDLSAN